MVAFQSSTPLNHLISFIICYVLFFTMPLNYLKHNRGYALNLLFKIIAIGVLLSSIVAICEFLVTNFFKMSFDYFPRPAAYDYDYEPLSIGGMIRARGFAEESGHFALYLISMYFLTLQYMKDNYGKVIVLTYSVLVFIALLASFSVSGLMFAFLSLSITYMIYNFNSPLKMIFILIFFFIFMLSVEMLIQYLTGFSILFDVVLSKLSGSTSMSDRSLKFTTVLSFMSDSDGVLIHLFGLGPAFYDTYGLPTLVTLYPLLYVQFGIVGLGVYLALISYPLFYAKLQGIKIDKYLFCSYLFSIFFFLGISNYWFPWFWVILAVIVSKIKLEKKIRYKISI